MQLQTQAIVHTMSRSHKITKGLRKRHSYSFEIFEPPAEVTGTCPSFGPQVHRQFDAHSGRLFKSSSVFQGPTSPTKKRRPEPEWLEGPEEIESGGKSTVYQMELSFLTHFFIQPDMEWDLLRENNPQEAWSSHSTRPCDWRLLSGPCAGIQ